MDVMTYFVRAGFFIFCAETAEFSRPFTVPSAMVLPEKIFQEAVHHWYDPLYRFAISLTRDPDDAADITQNAFHKLAEKGDQIADTGKIKSWLFSVVYRDFIDQYRKRRRYPQATLEALPAGAAEAAGDGTADRIDAQTMLHELESMDDKFRLPLVLFYLKCFSYREIAETLEIPMGTVMSRLRRGKDHLRERLEAATSETSNPPVNFPQKEANHG